VNGCRKSTAPAATLADTQSNQNLAEITPRALSSTTRHAESRKPGDDS